MTAALRVERRSMGIYPYIVHAGDYLWPVASEAVERLKQHAHDPPDQFAKHLLEIVAGTRYLRHVLEEVLAGVTDRDSALRSLQQAVLAL